MPLERFVGAWLKQMHALLRRNLSPCPFGFKNTNSNLNLLNIIINGGDPIGRDRFETGIFPPTHIIIVNVERKLSLRGAKRRGNLMRLLHGVYPEQGHKRFFASPCTPCGAGLRSE